MRRSARILPWTPLFLAACTLSAPLAAGPGDLVHFVELGPQHPRDITFDSKRFAYWVTSEYRSPFEPSGPIFRFSSGLGELLETVPLPFPGTPSDSAATGIAYDALDDTLWVVDSSTSRIVELLGDGAPNGNSIEVPFQPLSDPRGLAYDPGGDGGRGSLYLVESEARLVEELKLDGDGIRSFSAPERFEGVPIRPVDIDPVLENGTLSGFYLLVNGPATQFCSGAMCARSWALRLDSEGNFTGRFVPLDAAQGTVSALTRDTYPDNETGELLDVFICTVGSYFGFAFVVAGELSVQEVSDLRCQASERTVTLSWIRSQPYDSILVSRDGEEIAQIDGSRESYSDPDVKAGLHEYAVRGVRGGEEGALVRCSVWVEGDAGAILERATRTFECSPPQGDEGDNLCSLSDARLASLGCWTGISDQITRDPLDGSFYLSSRHSCTPRTIDHLDSGLRYLDTRSAAAPAGVVTSIAVRVTREHEELLYLVRFDQGSHSYFLMSQTLAGELLEEVPIFPPGGATGRHFPGGLAWDPGTDTFYYVDADAGLIVEIGLDGAILRTLPHPSPPANPFFVAYAGLAVAQDRGSLLTTTSDRLDGLINKVVEVSLDGAPTGYEIPLNPDEYWVQGIALAGRDLVAVTVKIDPGVIEVLRIQAFAGEAPPEPPFIRGDSNSSAKVDLSDPVFLLNYLFLGGPAPRCLDAADGDDNGNLEITDAVHVLGYLFLGGDAPPPPFPEKGADPTPDPLSCRAAP